MSLTRADYERCLAEYQKLFVRIVKEAHSHAYNGSTGLSLASGESVPAGRLAAIASDIDILSGEIRRIQGFE